jgi:hypothetical protein
VQHGLRVPRPCLDAEITAPRGDAENQNEVGLLRGKLRKVAIDRRITGGEDVRADNDIRKSGAAPARKRLDQSSARIEGDTWK